MKIAFITYSTPWSAKEFFILRQLHEAKQKHNDIIILPVFPDKSIYHEEALKIVESSLRWEPKSFKAIREITAGFRRSIKMVPGLFCGILSSRTRFRITARNILGVIISLRFAEAIKALGVSHIHSCWGTIPATIAMVTAKITGLPWSFELHRWDLYENNMLPRKVMSSKFVRCISEKGIKDLLKMVGPQHASKVHVIHTGIKPAERRFIDERVKVILSNPLKLLKVLVPANLEEVKGHKFLIDAVALLQESDMPITLCKFYGDGPLKEFLQRYASEKRCEKQIEFRGMIPNEQLIQEYKNHSADLVVLPSIFTSKGEHEGIPTALMEAMGYGVPVISTESGSIPELLHGGAGMLVKPESGEALASAIRFIAANREYAANLVRTGWDRIHADFNLSDNVGKLLKLIIQ
jgi:glycosyltransferase involved in cell wall biosynthesis